jgi:hypothetical protein
MGTRMVGMQEWLDDLHTLPERADKEFRTVVSHGALNIKTQWRATWNAAKHFPTHIPHLVQGIGYDTSAHPPEWWSAIIGVAYANRQSAIAHLLEYGSVNNAPIPGGQAALDAEEPRFADAVADAAVRLLDGS